MNGLERRISKIEEVLGIKEDLSFHGFLREFFSLISGRSRGLPSEDKAEDSEFDQAYDALFAKYANQASEVGRKRFHEDLAKFNNSLPDDGQLDTEEETS
jgi:hypothetical protein